MGPGERTTLSWRVLDAARAEIDGLGNVGLVGQHTLRLTETRDFTLIARNAEGAAVRRTLRVVVERPVLELAPRFTQCAAKPSQIKPGAIAVLLWRTENATQVTVDSFAMSFGSLANLPPSGSSQVRPSKTTNYRLIARNASGKTALCDIQVRVELVQIIPTIPMIILPTEPPPVVQ